VDIPADLPATIAPQNLQAILAQRALTPPPATAQAPTEPARETTQPVAAPRRVYTPAETGHNRLCGQAPSHIGVAVRADIAEHWHAFAGMGCARPGDRLAVLGLAYLPWQPMADVRAGVYAGMARHRWSLEHTAWRGTAGAAVTIGDGPVGALITATPRINDQAATVMLYLTVRVY
jgi:hypothetical protein